MRTSAPSSSNVHPRARTQYIVVKDSLVVKSKQTEVAKALAKKETGIKESVVPPKKILVQTVNTTTQKD